MKIVVSKDGPYIVSGSVPLAVQTIQPNAEGFSWDWVEGRAFETKGQYALCRCGHSNNKPFCDGSHARVHFNGAETATLSDAQELCAFARFCDPGGKIWALVPASDDPAARQLAIREGMQCPAGRLVIHDKRTGETLEPVLPPSIGVVEDPALQCSGPLWVRGGVRIESEGGAPYEVRNRVTLCRCGASSNKPFCNGSHASILFIYGLV